MPGLHIMCSTNNTNSISPSEKNAFLNTLSGMRHFQWYSSDVVFNDSNIILGKSWYDGYPIWISTNEKEVTLIDGAIYNRSAKNVEKYLLDVTLDKLSIDEVANQIKEFIVTSEGEFLIVKYERETGNCLIFNDALGRLPFYYCSSPALLPTRAIMSREPKFILPFLEKPDFDTNSAAEYLLFGYALGDKTLLKDIRRLPPASMLAISVESNTFLQKQILSWNLDPGEKAGKRTEELHRETRYLVDLFLDSLRNISHTFSENYTQVVSLSGGLDSRATLAGLCENGIDPIACSFPAGENKIAEEIAQTFKSDFNVISSPFRISNEDYVKLTDGLLDIGLDSRFSYFEGIREKMANRSIMYTGDGGDKTLGPLGFKSNISNVQELLSYIIENDHIFNVDQISSIMNIDKKSFMDHLKNCLDSYPEKTMEGKFAHFKIFERGFKWLFVGEDRNRFFLWSTTPFYSNRFFRASMSIPQNLKDHYVLYKDFLTHLNPVLPRIRYYDRLVALSIPNWALKFYLTMFEWLKKHFYERGAKNPIGFLLGEPEQKRTDETRNLILTLLSRKSQIGLFDSLKIRNLVLEEKNQVELNILATLILYVSVLESSHHHV